MLGHGRYRQIYQMSHEYEEVTVRVSFLKVDEGLSGEDIADALEDLSHRPHSERREFMWALHEQYRQTRCVGRIIAGLSEDNYYAHMRSTGYSVNNVALAMGANANHYQYFIFL